MHGLDKELVEFFGELFTLVRVIRGLLLSQNAGNGSSTFCLVPLRLCVRHSKFHADGLAKECDIRLGCTEGGDGFIDDGGIEQAIVV